MPATLELPPPEVTAPPAVNELPDARVLIDRTPEWMRSTPASVILTIAISATFILMANTPLWHTDLWDHLNYGQNILQTGVVSATEPLLRLCRGVSMINIPWLAQIGLAALNNTQGLTALQFTFAVMIAACLALIAWRTKQLSRSTIGALIACGIFFKVNLDQLLVIRPQLLGVVFYCAVVAWCFGRREFTRWTWIGLPLMFALWANIHGSFSMGLMMLGLTAVGRFGDVVVTGKSLRVALLDRQLHRIVLLGQLCAAAVLLNPAGLAIYPEVLNVAGNPNIESMFEWEPLTIRTAMGQSAAAAALLAFIAIKLSPRRLHCLETLAFVITGGLALWSARMLNWWAPVVGIVTGTHLMAAIRKTTPMLRNLRHREASGLWSVVNLGILWIAFALTPFGMKVVHGRVPDVQKLVSKETPLAVTAALDAIESLPSGICFVPAEWAGYVMNRGPKSLEPMVNLHVHVIPERVWNDYMRMINGPSDWNGLMDEYGINLAIVDKARQAALLQRIKESPDWREEYSDRQAAVFVRKQLID